MPTAPPDPHSHSATAAKQSNARRSSPRRSSPHRRPEKQSDALLRAALLLWPAAILAAAVAAPMAASAARPEGWFLYEVLEPFCHQQAERTWPLQGQPLGACARCLGVYAGILLAAMAAFPLPPKTIAAALALLAATWLVEFTGLAPVSNGIRWLTGFFLGASVGAAVLEWEPRHGPRWLARPRSVPG